MAETGMPTTPLPDASMKRYNFLFPVGILPKEPPFPDYYTSPMANGEDTEAPVAMRPRSNSNATLDAKDVRRNMKFSLTDLFSHFRIEDPTDVCPTCLD